VDSDLLTRNTNERAAWAAIRQLLFALGENPDREGLKDTPKRVFKALQELTAGLHIDPAKHLETTFPLENHRSYDDVILSRDIPFTSLCEHHLMLFSGVAHVAYVPNANGQIVGLSKLARVVEDFAKRPQVQERFTTQILQTIETVLKPLGTAVIINAQHTCQACRGIKKTGSMLTINAHGILATPEARAGLLRMIQL
jgi:GTP cyclohydrolase I